MFVNPNYQSLVVRQVNSLIAENNGQPLTVENLNALKLIPNSSDERISVITFLTNFFATIAARDGKPNISVADVNNLAGVDFNLNINA